MPFDLDDPTTIPLIRIEVGGHLGFGVFALARDHPHPVAPALADPEVPGPIPSAENPTPTGLNTNVFGWTSIDNVLASGTSQTRQGPRRFSDLRAGNP